MSLKSTMNPGTYHGVNQSPPFYEGWYFKLVSADQQHKLAIIPGVILGKDEHAFIQVIDGSDGSTSYAPFALSEFQPNFPQFDFKLGASSFNGKRIHLNVQKPALTLTGEIEFGKLSPWPVSLLSPGIMGWFAWVPRMETYHGVLSLNHTLRGHLSLGSKEMDFTGGLGYIEKDWGKNFPSSWV